MKKAKLKIFAYTGAAALFLFLLCLLFALVRSESAKASAIDIILPESGVAGDAGVAVFRSNEPIKSAFVTLKSVEGSQITSAEGFLFSERAKRCRTPRYTYAAVIAFPVTLESSDYTLEYAISFESGQEIADTSDVNVLAPQWTHEDIYLDSRNTAIKTDTSAQRIAQIDKLNTLLASYDAASPRFIKDFVQPVGRARVTSGFGDRRVYLYSNGGRSTSIHYGIDFGVPSGTPVAAAGDGIVVMAEERISTGYSIVIEHLPGVFSLYYHLNEMLCKTGDAVSAGDIIGRSGSTGFSTGPHLHWEFRANGEAISPDFFLNGGLASLVQ